MDESNDGTCYGDNDDHADDDDDDDDHADDDDDDHVVNSYRQHQQVPADSRTGKSGMWSSQGGPVRRLLLLLLSILLLLLLSFRMVLWDDDQIIFVIIIILMEEGENNEGDDGQGDNFWEPSKRSKEFSNFIAAVSRKPIWETLKKDNILCTVWKLVRNQDDMMISCARLRVWGWVMSKRLWANLIPIVWLPECRGYQLW